MEPVCSEDEMDSGINVIKALFVRILVDKQITVEKFNELHRAYMIRIQREPKEIASSRNNLLNAITKKKSMTYKMFEFVTKNILGYNLVGITITLKDRENKTHVVSLDRNTF